MILDSSPFALDPLSAPDIRASGILTSWDTVCIRPSARAESSGVCAPFAKRAHGLLSLSNPTLKVFSHWAAFPCPVPYPAGSHAVIHLASHAAWVTAAIGSAASQIMEPLKLASSQGRQGCG